MKLLRLKKKSLTAPNKERQPLDTKEGRVLSSRNETNLRQCLSLLKEVVDQVEGEDLIEGKSVVVWNAGESVRYGLADAKALDTGDACRVERLLSTEDEPYLDFEYPLNGYRKSGKSETLATAALTEIAFDELGMLAGTKAGTNPNATDDADDDEDDGTYSGIRGRKPKTKPRKQGEPSEEDDSEDEYPASHNRGNRDVLSEGDSGDDDSREDNDSGDADHEGQDDEDDEAGEKPKPRRRVRKEEKGKTSRW